MKSYDVALHDLLAHIIRKLVRKLVDGLSGSVGTLYCTHTGVAKVDRNLSFPTWSGQGGGSTKEQREMSLVKVLEESVTAINFIGYNK